MISAEGGEKCQVEIRLICNRPPEIGNDLSVAKADPDGAGGVHDLSMRVYGFQLANGVGDIHRVDLGFVQADHLAESSLGDQVDRGYAETSG